MRQKTYRFYSQQPVVNNLSDYLLIKEAYRSFRKKRYRDTILLLENLIDSGIKDPYPYVLITLSFLLTNQFKKADSTLKRLKMIDPEYKPYIQLELFLFLKSSATLESTISRYVDAFNRFPDDKYISRSLKHIRDTNDFNSLQKKARIQDFIYLPKPRKKYYIIKGEEKKGKGSISKWNYLLIGISSILVIILATLYHNRKSIYYYLSGKKVFNKSKIENIDRITIGPTRFDLFEKIKKKKTDIFYFSNDSIEKDFIKAKHLIKKGDYNGALILLNKLSNSNVNLMVKERVEFLVKFILDVDDREFEAITYDKVKKKPFLYKGIAIKWTGKIANLKRKNDKLFFNLLIDYKDRDVFTGISDVYSERDYSNIENGDIIEIKAILANIIGPDKRLYLVAKEIDRL